MARLNAKWFNFTLRGQKWDHFWQDATASGNAVLVIQDALHGHTADNLVLVQHNVLVIQDALHAHTAENVTLTPSGGEVIPVSSGSVFMPQVIIYEDKVDKDEEWLMLTR